jgi:hypothetical protein
MMSEVFTAFSFVPSPQKGRRGGDPDRKLLDNVWGEVPEKQTTAIMGPRCVLVANEYSSFGTCISN